MTFKIFVATGMAILASMIVHGRVPGDPAKNYHHNGGLQDNRNFQKESSSSTLHMSLSTNVLYDALLLPNIGLDIYIGRNWSLNANWMYGWWDNNRRHRYWRAYGGDIVARRWFGTLSQRKTLTGHHLGFYGQILTYDFEFGGKGQIAGRPGGNLWQKPTLGVGVEYGFSLPVARRVNIDFTIGIGYLGGEYYEYKPQAGEYIWLATKRRHWFGPTKAQVSLVWLIGKGNDKKKGVGL